MELGTFSNIAEIVAAAGVVGSILFLGFETRRNSKILLRTNHREITRYLDESILTTLQSPSFSEMYLRGFENLDSLTPPERFNFDIYMLSWLRASEHSLIDFNEGFITEDAILPMRHAIFDHLSTPGGRQWWVARRNWFTVQGQQEFDEILSSEIYGHANTGPNSE